MNRARPDAGDPILRMADAIGGLIEFWGFGRHMGRVWALLYFSREPLPASELRTRLGLSAGTISMTMKELLAWGVVHKTHRPGQRRDYYEPETDIWKMVSRVFRERELARIEVAIDAFETALAQMAARARSRDADERDHSAFVHDRVEGLLGLARIGNDLLRAMLSGQTVSALPLKDFGRFGS